MHKSDHGGCLFPKTSELANDSRYVLLQYLKVCNPLWYKYSAVLQATAIWFKTQPLWTAKTSSGRLLGIE